MTSETLVKIEGANFVRDIKTMQLSSTDYTERNEYYLKVKLLKTQKQEINKLNDELSTIKSDMSEIKQLLAELIKDKNV
jgi:gluconate kinase